MARKLSSSADTLDPFTKEVEVLFEHFHDPQWLGVHSRLGQPYMLGARLTKYQDGHTAIRRGRWLQIQLLEALAALSSSGELKLPSDGEMLKWDADHDMREASQKYALYLCQVIEQQGSQDQLILYWKYIGPQDLEPDETFVG